MKRYLILLLFLAASAACFGQAKSERRPSTMRLDATRWDFGQIREQDGEVSHTFTFTNTGTTPFVIENVSVACGCTRPQFSKAPVLPGKSAQISVAFDPEGRPGRFLKDIVITSNQGANHNVITVEGVVTPRPPTIEEEFPVEMGSGVRFSMTALHFRYVGQGTAKSTNIEYINTSSRAVSLQVGSAAPFVNNAPTTLCAGCRGEFVVTCDLTKTTLWGMISQNLRVTVDGKTAKQPIAVSAIGVDDMPNIGKEPTYPAPAARLNSQFQNFGDAREGETLRTVFTLSNDGEAPLEIRAVQPGEGVKCSLRAGSRVAAGKSVDFYVEWKVPATKNRLTRSIVIIVNDPMRPMREIRLTANVK